MAVRKKKIVALDDRAIIVRMLELLLGTNYEFRGFTKEERALSYLESQEADLLILDIDMPEMTGIEVARELLKENRDIRIFFISNHEEMVFEAIHTRPMRFIRKNNLINEMTEAILFLKKELEKEDGVICFTSGKNSHELKSEKIMYIESEGHYLRIISKSEMIRIRGKISDYADMLKEHYFLQIQKGILLNMKYISGMKGEHVFLQNNLSFSISRGKRDEIRKEFLKYMRREI